MMLSIIIPVFNEKNTIDEILKRVLRVKINKEIIIVDGGSTDGTVDLLKKYEKNDNIKVIHFKEDKGKGSAVRKGLEYVTGDIVIIQDADLEYDPEDYHKVIKPILENKSNIVYGSRFLNKKREFSYNLNLFCTQLLSKMSNIMYNTKITDEPTCYKAFRTNVIKKINLTCDGFEFCPEVTAKASKMGHKIFEVPISYKPRTKSEGKKINWKDGGIAIWTLIKYWIRD